MHSIGPERPRCFLRHSVVPVGLPWAGDHEVADDTCGDVAAVLTEDPDDRAGKRPAHTGGPAGQQVFVVESHDRAEFGGAESGTDPCVGEVAQQTAYEVVCGGRGPEADRRDVLAAGGGEVGVAAKCGEHRRGTHQTAGAAVDGRECGAGVEPPLDPDFPTCEQRGQQVRSQRDVKERGEEQLDIGDCPRIPVGAGVEPEPQAAMGVKHTLRRSGRAAGGEDDGRGVLVRGRDRPILERQWGRPVRNGLRVGGGRQLDDSTARLMSEGRMGGVRDHHAGAERGEVGACFRPGQAVIERCGHQAGGQGAQDDHGVRYRRLHGRHDAVSGPQAGAPQSGRDGIHRLDQLGKRQFAGVVTQRSSMRPVRPGADRAQPVRQCQYITHEVAPLIISRCGQREEFPSEYRLKRQLSAIFSPSSAGSRWAPGVWCAGAEIAFRPREEQPISPRGRWVLTWPCRST